MIFFIKLLFLFKICIDLMSQIREGKEDLVLQDLLDKRVIKAEMVLMVYQADLDQLENLVFLVIMVSQDCRVLLVFLG